MKYNVGTDGRFNAICYNIVPGYGLHIYKEYPTKEKAEKSLKEIQKWSSIKKSKEFDITESQATYGFVTMVSFKPSKLPVRTPEEHENATCHFEEEPWKMKDEEWEKEQNNKKEEKTSKEPAE